MLASTLASIGDAVVVTDKHGHITLLNPVAETLTGWTEDDAFSKPVEDVLQLVDEAFAADRGESADARAARPGT